LASLRAYRAGAAEMEVMESRRPREAWAPGSGCRTDGLRTSPVGRAGVVAASEMATGVVVGSAVIPAPRVVAAAWPQERPCLPGISAVVGPAVQWASMVAAIVMAGAAHDIRGGEFPEGRRTPPGASSANSS
jgi:hypothetical protein